MIEILFTLFALAAGAQPEHGIASVFGGSSDKHRGGKAPCLSPPRRVRANDWGVARRHGACGDVFAVVNPRTGRIAIVPLIDFGPWGGRQEDGTWALKKRRSDPGRWIGIADLTRPVAAAIGHRGGKERVVLVPIYRNPAGRRRKVRP